VLSDACKFDAIRNTIGTMKEILYPSLWKARGHVESADNECWARKSPNKTGA
jgi:hypothetical protein